MVYLCLVSGQCQFSSRTTLTRAVAETVEALPDDDGFDEELDVDELESSLSRTSIKIHGPGIEFKASSGGRGGDKSICYQETSVREYQIHVSIEMIHI
jgi:hypothetical protein